MAELLVDFSIHVTYKIINTIRLPEGTAMNTKLTLRMDESLIASAKEYSAKTGKSVSRIVADFFQTIKNENQEKEHVLPPTVRSLKGALKGSSSGEEEYKKYLEEKYL